MEKTEKGEQRAAYPLWGAVRATQEIIFLRSRIVRIEVIRYQSFSDTEGKRFTSQKPKEAEFIDSLGRIRMNALRSFNRVMDGPKYSND